MDDRIIMPRITLEQIKHCIQESLSAHLNDEDPRCIVDDLNQAKKLIENIMPTFLSMAKGANDGKTYNT